MAGAWELLSLPLHAFSFVFDDLEHRQHDIFFALVAEESYCDFKWSQLTGGRVPALVAY